jgi:hypothetical protein
LVALDVVEDLQDAGSAWGGVLSVASFDDGAVAVCEDVLS